MFLPLFLAFHSESIFYALAVAIYNKLERKKSIYMLLECFIVAKSIDFVLNIKKKKPFTTTTKNHLYKIDLILNRVFITLKACNPMHPISFNFNYYREPAIGRE